MVDIASCESQYRQFETDGSVRRGRANPQDVGVFQVNEKYHLAESRRLGYDIYTLEGNIAYAEYVYENQGTTPWKWSYIMDESRQLGWKWGECTQLF